MVISVRFGMIDYLFFLFHARLLTRIFPYGRILAGQVGAFAPVSVDDADFQNESR